MNRHTAPVPIADRPGRRIVALAARDWADHALRAGHLMTLNTAVSAALGFAFWVAVARMLPVDAVGGGMAAVAVILTLANLGQLNLYQSAGVLLARTRGDDRGAAFRLWGFAAGATLIISALAALVGMAAGWFDSLPVPLILVVVCAVAWSAFAVKDALLIARRHAGSVPILTGVYGVTKIVLLIWLVSAPGVEGGEDAALGGAGAVVLATFAPVLLALPIAAVILLLPARHLGGAVPTGAGEAVQRGDASFVALDYAGSVASQACTTLLPFVVYLGAGAEAAGVFSAAWAIVLVLDTLAHNASVPLAAELARSPERAGSLLRPVRRRTLLVVVPAAAAVALLAHPLLSLFGSAYADAGTPVLQVLAAASVARALLVLRLAVLRAERRTGAILVVELLHAAAVLGVAAGTVPALGALGMAAGWITGQAVALTAATLADRLLLAQPRTPLKAAGHGR